MKRLSVLLIVLAPTLSVHAQGTIWKKDAIKYVQSLQITTGGFLSMAPRPEIRLRPTLRATSSALRALHYLGGMTPNADTAKKFVESCYHPMVGSFSDFPGGEPDVFTTAVGVMAVKEVGGPLDRLKEPVVQYFSKNARGFDDIRIAAAGLERLDATVPNADEWLKQLEKDRNKDGTWGRGAGQARETASYAVTYLRLGGKLETRDLILKTLREGQRKDGGFGKADSEASDLETTYRVMRCFMMLKEQPRDPAAVGNFLLKCHNSDGGFGVQPGENSTVGATYFAAIVNHWLGK